MARASLHVSRSVLLALALSPSVGFAQGEDAPSGDGPAAADGAEKGDAVAEAAPPIGEEPENAASARSRSEELESFQRVLGRFSSRMGEFEADSRAWVSQREADEHAMLDASYDAVIREMEADDKALRLTAMKRFETYLDKYPNSTDSAHVMFRLAELYFEQSEEEFMSRDAEFRRLMDELTESGDIEEFPEEPRKDYGRSVRLYRRILRDYPDYEYADGTYYMLGYCLSESSSAQYDEEEGLAVFQGLVGRFGESRFAPVAHLRIGEYYFDYNKLDEAIPHYRRVVELEGPEGSLYDEGLYKLAWSQYKKSDYGDALVLLNQLLDWSEDNYARTGRESSMAPEAIDYTAISFSDLADRESVSPLAIAQRFYGDVGARDYEAKVYKKLADVLTQQARYEDSVSVYRYIQDRWPNDAENPTYQWTLATLYMSMVPARVTEAQAAIAQLNTMYNDESTWWEANRANPDAQAVARSFIEQSLAAVATQVHEKAGQTQDPADFARAADLYAQYLAKFPFARDYYEVQWYLAQTRLFSGDMDGAEREYAQLYKAGDHHFKEAALLFLRQIYLQRVVTGYGGPATLPPDAEVEKVVELANGKTRNIYRLGPQHEPFVNLSDALVAADFGAVVTDASAELADVEAKLKRARTPEEKKLLETERTSLEYILENVARVNVDYISGNRHAIAYQSAQVLYEHGRFTEARARFVDIIAKYPATDEAAYSAKLHVDSFTDEEDYENVRKWASIYASKSLGSGPSQEGLSELATIEQQASLKLLEALVAADKREEAASGYLQFIKDYPKADPELLKNALYNGAQNYDLTGRADQSIPLFERYINEYPEDPLSKPLFFRLAGVYAQSLELETAIRYYEGLYDRTNGRGEVYADAAGALINAGLLKVGIGDYQGAAQTFERYERELPGEPDRESVYWRAAEQWERVSADRAARFYREYLRKYPEENPDHVMEALYRLAMRAEDGGRSRDIEKSWDALEDGYARLSPGGKIGPLGRKYAAAAELRNVQDALDAFMVVPDRVKSNAQKYAELMGARRDELPRLEAQALALIKNYSEFESTSAALFTLGSAYYAYADQLYAAPLPAEFKADPELEMVYYEKLDELRIPLEDKGKGRLAAVLQTAKEQGLWSEWQTRTLGELSKRAPAEYSPEKEQFPVEGESSAVPAGAPLPLPEPEPEPNAKDGGGE